MKKEYLEKCELCIKDGDESGAHLYIDYILDDYSENEDVEIYRKLIQLYYKYMELMILWWDGSESTDDPDRFHHYGELIKIYIKAEAYEEAVKYFNDDIFEKEIELYGGVSDEMIDIYKYLPCFYHKLGYKEKEVESSKKLNDMLMEILNSDWCGKMESIGVVYLEMGKIMKTLKECEKAIEYFESSTKYFENNDLYDEEILEVHDSIIELYELLENDDMIKLYKEKRINLLNK